MAIRFQCPSCNAVRTISERALGRETQCPQCGSPVQLPALESIDEARGEKPVLAQDVGQPTVVDVIDVAPEPSSAEKTEADLVADQRDLAATDTSFIRPKPTASDDMDMTPMVDVTFLLLIFFMVTASFSVQKSIQRPVSLSDDPSTQPVQQNIDDNPDIVTVQVDEYNAYNIITTEWDRVVGGSKQDLIVALSDAQAGDASGRQPTKLIVQAHEDCIHASVIAALDAGREAHFSSFEVSTVEQFD